MGDFHPLRTICQDYTGSKVGKAQDFLTRNNSF